jgi:hypothetical protein
MERKQPQISAAQFAALESAELVEFHAKERAMERQFWEDRGLWVDGDEEAQQ